MTISILQWNIWYKEDIRRIAQFLKATNADVVCLQELTIDHPQQMAKNTPLYIAQQLGYDQYYSKEIPIKTTNNHVVNLANGIFSRFPLVSTRFAWINQPTGRGGYDDEPRAYIEATLKVANHHLTIGTIHMSYTHRFQSTSRKEREANALVKEINRHKNTFIFTGDLNAVPGSYTIEAISSHLQHAGPDFQQKTWTTKPFSYQGFEETKQNWRLDYIFTTRDIKVLSAEILETTYSDHLPILATLSID